MIADVIVVGVQVMAVMVAAVIVVTAAGRVAEIEQIQAPRRWGPTPPLPEPGRSRNTRNTGDFARACGDIRP